MATPHPLSTRFKACPWTIARVILCALSLLLASAAPAQVSAAPHKATIKKNVVPTLTPEQQYASLKQQLVQLNDDKGNARNAEQWQTLAHAFYQLHLSHKKETLGANALFMSAQVLRAKGQRFLKNGDIQLARQRYLEFVDLYPGSNLADDALYEAATLSSTGSQSAPAEAIYAQVLAQYPQGDQAVKAQKKLEEAKPLPKADGASDQVTAQPTPALGSQTGAPPSAREQLAVKTASSYAVVAPIKFWSTAQYSRLVVATSAPVPYAAKKGIDQPGQLLLELQQSTLEDKASTGRTIEQGLLKGIQPNQVEAGLVRFKINLQPFAEYKAFTLQDPFRIVVDIYGEATVQKLPEASTPSDKDLPGATASPTAPENIQPPDLPILTDHKKILTSPKTTAKGKGKQEQLSLAQQLGLGVRTIVIDPGHGGKDPGAMAFGLKEKDIVLKVAQKLATILKQTQQYQVVLTRTKDVFIPLEKRTAMANSHKADLFISIHVNAHADQASSGIETYFLNLATDADAMRVAALENASSNHSIGELQDILSSLMNNSKIDESSRLARFVQSNLISGLKPTYKARDLGVKQAPFYVLIGAEMPAILAELSFITNPAEAKLLQDDTHLEQLAKQLAGGIVAYIDHHHAAARLQ